MTPPSVELVARRHPAPSHSHPTVPVPPPAPDDALSPLECCPQRGRALGATLRQVRRVLAVAPHRPLDQGHRDALRRALGPIGHERFCWVVTSTEDIQRIAAAAIRWDE
jgi:hypothetical protein